MSYSRWDNKTNWYAFDNDNYKKLSLWHWDGEDNIHLTKSEVELVIKTGDAQKFYPHVKLSNKDTKEAIEICKSALEDWDDSYID